MKDERKPPPGPEVVTRPVVVTLPGSFLPPGAAFPSHYVKPAPIPCARCRCVRLADQSQAVRFASSFKGTADFDCQNCSHRFKLPIRDEPT